MKETEAGRSLDSRVVAWSTQGARRDALLYFPATLIPAVMGALGNAAYTRIFTPAALGLYTLALSVVQLAMTFQFSWHEKSTIRFVSADENAYADDVDSGSAGRVPGRAVQLALGLTWVNFAIFSLLGGLTLIVMALVRPAAAPMTATAVVFGSASLVLGGFSAIQRGRLKVWSATKARVIVSVLGLVVTLVAVLLFGARASFLMLGPALALVMAALILINDVRRDSPGLSLRGTLRPQEPSGGTGTHLALTVRSFLSFGLPLTGFYVAGWILNLSDRFLLFGLRNETEVGIYAPNYAMGALVISLVAVPLSSAASARMMRFSDLDSAETVRQTISSGARDFLIATLPVLTWISLEAQDVSTFLLGAEFRSGAAVIPLVAAGSLTWALGMYLHKPLEIQNRTLVLLILALVCCGANILMNLLLIPRFGYIAAAWSTLFANSLYPLMAYVITFRTLRFLVPWRSLLWLGVAAAISVAVIGFGLRGVSLGGAFLKAALTGLLVEIIAFLCLWVGGEISPRRLVTAVRKFLPGPNTR